jgi:hypothetical protein
MDRVTFVTEPLLGPDFVQYRVLVPLVERLAKRFELRVAAPAFAPRVRSRLESKGITAIDGRAWFPEPRHDRDEAPSYVLSWSRDALLGTNARRLERRLKADGAHLRVNFSMTTACESDLWWIQGRPLGPTLATIAPGLSLRFRLAARVVGPAVGVMDRHHFLKAASRAKRIYANSRFLAVWWREEGLPVRGAIPPYVYPLSFRPTTTNPSRDFVLVYLGKETDTLTIRRMIQMGIPVKLFGAKSAAWVEGGLRGLNGGTNVEALGRVSHEELCELYTHALFTAFPFTEEPSGLVPIESMACGTPVLTYDRQGPAETIVPGGTGWLAKGPERFLDSALAIYRSGYPAAMRTACLEQARRFHVDAAVETWTDLLSARLNGTPDPRAVELLAEPKLRPGVPFAAREPRITPFSSAGQASHGFSR